MYGGGHRHSRDLAFMRSQLLDESAGRQTTVKVERNIATTIMAKTKRKHLAALAAMTDAGVMNDEMRQKVDKKQVQGDSIGTEGCSADRADADMVAVVGQTLKQFADGASLSKLQTDGRVAAKCSLMVENTSVGSAANSNALIEFRKQRIIIKIPPLPAKMFRKRQEVAEEPGDHAKKASTTLEAEYKEADNSEMDTVATKRRKIGVDVLKKNVSTLLADIDNTFSRVMLKLGDFRKQRVSKEESRDSKKFVSGPASPGEHPKKKLKLKNDCSDFPAVALAANAGDCSAGLLHRNSLNFGADHEGEDVLGDHEATACPMVFAPVPVGTEALDSPVNADEVVSQRNGVHKKDSKEWRGRKKASGSCHQENLKTSRKKKVVKQSAAALHGRDPDQRFCEGAPGDVHGSQLERKKAIHQKPVTSGSQGPPMTVRSLRSRKGTPLMGPDDLPVHKRRRRQLKTNDEALAQPSGSGNCFFFQEGRPAEGMTACALEHLNQRRENGHSSSGTTSMVAISGLGNRDLLVAGHNLGSESAAQDLTFYFKTLKHHSCQDRELGQVRDTSRSANRETVQQKQEVLSVLDQTSKGAPFPSARPGAYNGALGVDRKVDIFITKLKAGGGLPAFLRARGLEQLMPLFEAQNVDESALLQLTMDSLKEMGIHALGPRRKLISAISSLCSL